MRCGVIMTDISNTPAPEENKPDTVQPEGGLRAELARVRGRNKTLRGVAAVLLSLFIILAALSFLAYRKISATIAPFQQAFQAFPPPAAGYQPENKTLPMRGVYSSTSMPASTLGLFTGGMPGGFAEENFNPEQGEQLLKAINKYADRPIVKEFLADLRKNPEIAAAFSSGKGVNPVVFMAAMQNARGMDKMMIKYATRPAFLKLLTEVMRDPYLKPFMRNMPAGMGMMPPGMPQGAAISVPTGPQSRASRLTAEYGDGEVTFDPSVISGPAKPARAPSRKAPPPVDSGR